MEDIEEVESERSVDPVPNTIKKDIRAGGYGVVSKLIEKGIIANDQLQVAIEEMKSNQDFANETVLDVLVKLGFLSERTLLEIINPDNSVKQINLKERILKQDIVRKIPRQFAMHNKIIAIDEDAESVTVATDNISNILIIDKVKKYFDYKRVNVLHASEQQINKVIEKYYQYSLKMSDIIAEIEAGDVAVSGLEENSGYKDPIVRLVDAIIIEAVTVGASDIHFEPDEYFVRIRYRLDGVLSTKFSFHKKYWHRIVGRIKIMSGLNIAESRKPQDGGINMEVNDKEIDFRVSILPGVQGENIVMRILDCTKGIVAIKDLGFSEHSYHYMRLALQKPEGIVILTGPTGSGKTTTLYSLINEINHPSKNIMTLEDPVEYNLPLIRQTGINMKAGLDFASGLRSILRQDPDIIMIGEIRDYETADIAIKAALTGHQVYSTLHTNDAISGVSRLIDIGIKSFLIGNALNAVIAQRLVRKLCNSCKTGYKANADITKVLNSVFHKENSSYTLYRPQGCSACYQTGYKGRTAVTEIFYVGREISAAIAANIPHHQMYTLAKKHGFVPMQEHGLEKVADGVTSMQELVDNVNMNEYLEI